MAENRTTPAKTRSTAAGRNAPGRSRSTGIGESTAGVDKPSQHSSPRPGHKVRKGALKRGRS